MFLQPEIEHFSIQLQASLNADHTPYLALLHRRRHLALSSLKMKNGVASTLVAAGQK